MTSSNFNLNYEHITIGTELTPKNIPVDFKKYEPAEGDICIVLEGKDSNPQIASSTIQAGRGSNQDFMSVGYLPPEWGTFPLDVKKLIFQSVINRLQASGPNDSSGATLCVSITWFDSDGVLHKLTGNLGDSHEHLFNKKESDESVVQPELLVKLHTTKNPEERKRVLDEFGYIFSNRISTTVGSLLEPTRVLGDFEYKPFVSDTLDFTYSKWKLTPEQTKIFFMSCDGYDPILKDENFLKAILKNASIDSLAQDISSLSSEIFLDDNLSYILVIYEGKKILTPHPPLLTALSDGHGGSQRARHASQNILETFKEVIAQVLKEGPDNLKKEDIQRLENIYIRQQKKYHLKLILNQLIPCLPEAKAFSSTNYIGSYQLSFKVNEEKEKEIINSLEKHHIKYYKEDALFNIPYMLSEEIERTKRSKEDFLKENNERDITKELNPLTENYTDELIDFIEDFHQITHNESKIDFKEFKDEYRLVLQPLDKKESKEIKPLYKKILSREEQELPKRLQNSVIDINNLEVNLTLIAPVLYITKFSCQKKTVLNCEIATLENYKKGEFHYCTSLQDKSALIHEALMMQTLKSEYTQEFLGIGFNGSFINITSSCPFDLKSFLKKSKNISFEDKCILAVNICQGLQHIHDHHLVYGILTHEGIRFNEEGRMRITDFSSTHKAEEKIKNDDGLMNKIQWCPLECMKDGKTTKESDIHSLGMILYEIFTGLTPFEELSDYQIVSRKEPTSDLSFNNCPLQIKQLILDCCHIDPKKRPTPSKIAMRLNALSNLSESIKEEKLVHSTRFFGNKTVVKSTSEKNNTNCLVM